MTSTASQMSIMFESDESISHEGFTATFVVLDAATGRKTDNKATRYSKEILTLHAKG